jgi:hypothetical protein
MHCSRSAFLARRPIRPRSCSPQRWRYNGRQIRPSRTNHSASYRIGF